ncbi:aspartate aminotransferase, chloroplastic [Dorcoceras hygrometricum]|uniref:Aspartate aminotransferase, chloroplastic n=1 Tax=Dorcoceras hygrometricum TaxID=472368 RepID=A0A2Z7B3Y6_9LAMI|nr:aspartate aminotransferase, chloroplastic [Dorcoceras hygrometricum]
MASSYYTNTLHVDFESVLAMDNPSMISMFKALTTSGLQGFLGCPAVIYEAALIDFFENALVRDGVVISTVAGKLELFAETFELPVEGLNNLSEIPKDLVFYEKSIVSLTGEPVSMSGKKKEMKIYFSILCDIMAKTINVKARSFDPITQEKFLMIAGITCGVHIPKLQSLATFQLLTMASSYYTNTLHVNFESVLAMADPGTVSMFQALMASGLEGFLGCPTVIYESALVDFFENASVWDDMVVSIVHGVTVEISKQLFAETFELPVEGLSEFSEIPTDLVFDARSIVSLSGEPGIVQYLEGYGDCGVEASQGLCRSVCLLLENFPNLELGESSEFPSSKILTDKTFHRYVVLNDKAGAEGAADAPKTPPGAPPAGLKPRPAVLPGFPANTQTRKQTKPRRDMGSNPSMESNYKTAINSKNKMQMLCMRCWSTTKDSNRKGSQSTSQLYLQQMVATGCVPSVVANHSPGDNTPIPDASTTRPAVAQPMNCGRSNSLLAQSVRTNTRTGKNFCPFATSPWTTRSLQDGYRMKELFERSPTLPQLEERWSESTGNGRRGLRSHLQNAQQDLMKRRRATKTDLSRQISRYAMQDFIKRRRSKQNSSHTKSNRSLEQQRLRLTVFVQNSLFIGLSITDIRSFVSSIVFERTALRDVQSSFVPVASQNVQLAFSSVVEDEDNQMDIDQRLASPTTTADSSMNFIDNDILLGDDATSNQPSLPTVATNLSTYLDDFRTLLWQRLDAQSEDIRHIGDSHNDVLSRLTTLDKGLRDALLQQGEYFRKLIQNVRQDGRTLDDGEVSSSRPQPPPDDQNRGSSNTGGDNVRTTDIVDRFSGSMSREGQSRGRSGGRSSSGNRSGSSKRRHYSSSGGPFRRSFEDWLG